MIVWSDYRWTTTPFKLLMKKEIKLNEMKQNLARFHHFKATPNDTVYENYYKNEGKGYSKS